MTGQPAHELILAGVAMVALAGVYAWLAADGIPPPSSGVGYALGISGFVLMLSAETLYSLRKRLPNFHLGPMRLWLQAHVFAGLVGPFLVLLHSGWRFHGLAGMLTAVVGVVVLSGVVGRYIYTSVPRQVEGAEPALVELEEKIALVERRLQQAGATHRNQAQAAALEQLLIEHQRLLGEVRSLAVTRRWLSVWHLFHVPLSVGMFVLAFVHIGGALYYTALTR